MITKGEGKDKKNRGRRSEAQSLRDQQKNGRNDGMIGKEEDRISQ
jgi:hypothetical protein